jgi:hypothetical protein
MHYSCISLAHAVQVYQQVFPDAFAALLDVCPANSQPTVYFYYLAPSVQSGCSTQDVLVPALHVVFDSSVPWKVTHVGASKSVAMNTTATAMPMSDDDVRPHPQAQAQEPPQCLHQSQQLLRRQVLQQLHLQAGCLRGYTTQAPRRVSRNTDFTKAAHKRHPLSEQEPPFEGFPQEGNFMAQESKRFEDFSQEGTLMAQEIKRLSPEMSDLYNLLKDDDNERAELKPDFLADTLCARV